MGASLLLVAATVLLVDGRLAARTGAQAAIPEDTLIRLERTACYGTCPVYTVTIDAHGAVTYEGIEYVRVKGRQTGRIPVARVAAILDTARRIRFFALADRYARPVTDLPTTFVTITEAGRSKKVEDYTDAPDGLRQLEREIDEAAGTKRWIS